MIKKLMTEEEIKLNYITPAIENSGWHKQQIRMEKSFTDGRVIVRGNNAERAKRKKADYLLYHNSIPLAIVEAKDNKHSIGAGLQQAMEYALMLDVPFAYSSNGDGFIEHDFLTGVEKEITLNCFPTKQELWIRYKNSKGIDEEQEKIIETPNYFGIDEKDPRYYQQIAINKTVEAIAKGQDRILLVMATGTGKTYTAFQIIHKLKQAGVKKKVLYLADRNILIDQTIDNDFKPFEKIITKIRKRNLDSSYEIYMSLYQQLVGEDEEEIFREFKPEFFDLIIVDECHRGSAKEDSRWRRILEYFDKATHIGMTATPKETKNISSSTYFGEPLYTYSLRQGIEDGFLAPYKVIRVGLDIDLMGYRPDKGQKDIYGQVVEDREYNIKDYDQTIIIDDRTQLVAEKVTEFLKKTDRFSKTIVFCVDIDHAERMRMALVNCNQDLCMQNPKYVMRITGDNQEGKNQLDNFIALDSKYPNIVTTSELMTTGVDCKTCKLIVLDNNFGDNGMIKFKQIIGRGTRIREDFGKMYFTIMDFRNASRLFADPDFDGEPTIVYEAKENDPIIPDENVIDVIEKDKINDFIHYENEDITFSPRRIYRVKGIQVTVLSERVQYYDKNGKLITESLKDYSRKNILQEYATLDDFLNKWTSGERREAIINELKEHGILLNALREESGQKDIDEFDLICHIAYDKKPLTKSERARNAKQKAYLEKYSEQAQKVLIALLDKYAKDNINDIDDIGILSLNEFKQFGGPLKIIKMFGNKDKYIQAVRDLRQLLYAA